MTKIFLKTSSSFYYERMIASAPSDFTEMVNIGMRLEEGVRGERLSKEEVSSSKKHGGSFARKKEGEINAVSMGRKRRPHVKRNPQPRHHHYHVSSVIPVFSNNQSIPIQPQRQQQPQQGTNNYNTNTNNNQQQQNFERKKVSFDLIPMSYAKLYPSLILKNLLQQKNPPKIPEPLPWWYKPELRCTFHQGAPDHDIENFYPLKYEVQKLVKSGMVSFEDCTPNVKANPLHAHGNSSVSMVDGCPGAYKVYDARHMRQSLVVIYRDVCSVSDCEHDHDGCVICSVNPRGCVIINRDIQRLMDEGLIHVCQSREVDDVNVIVPVFKTLEWVVIQFDTSNSNNINKSVSSLVIWLTGPVSYASDRAISNQYNATMLENGQEVPLPMTNSVVKIADIEKVTRNSHVFGHVFPEEVIEDVSVGKKVDVPAMNPVSAPKCQPGESNNLKPNNDDEEALQKVLEQAYVDHDVIVDQFDHIVANITSCNNLSFCDEELPEEGKNHNLALHISMNCKEDALSNVLVDIGSSLNLLPKSTLSRLTYQDAPMRYSGVIVKAFDGSRKTVIGEVDLLVKIGPSDFQITFQVMDIHSAYSYLLGRTWIHEAGAVTTTLHQKLKFVKNGKLVIVAEDEVGTPFQALSIAEVKKTGTPMSSFKDTQKIIEDGSSDQWGRMSEVAKNKNRARLGFQRGLSYVKAQDTKPSFRNGGFIHGNEQHSAPVIEGDEDEDCTNFVMNGKACNNWVAVDVPVIVHRSK
ncbi:hypothetical protein KIW84_022883 [Lathyrus oleraceus]|uniref:Uncharacterized protein n=1 Tax=Pisum sativum TaxID=3888 RepID=A0A9D5BB81_PEA|nr:hypothetical protein KIW84_022883 [Pisum sativum]